MSEDRPQYLIDAEEMAGSGYSLEIHPQTTVIRRSGREMVEEVIPAFVKVSTAFKEELAKIDGNALKVWLFIALSINRNTEQAHPGVRLIAEKCGLGVNTVTSCIKELEGLGLLTVNREKKRYNIYEIPDYVSANTVTKTVTENESVTPKAESVTQKDESVTESGRICDLTREPEEPDSGKKRKKTTLNLDGVVDAGFLFNAGVPSEEIAAQLAKEKIYTDIPLRLEVGLVLGQFPQSEGAKAVYRWIAAQEVIGQSLDTFIEWVMGSDKRKEYAWTYHKDPSLIKRDWPRAMADKKKEEFRPAYFNPYVPSAQKPVQPPPPNPIKGFRRE